MKIAFLVSTFPALSQTFILNQITGLLDRGHEVDIFAYQPDSTTKVHPAVEQYQLLSRTHYWPRVPETWLPRLIQGVRLLMTHGIRQPRQVLKALNVLKYGKYASSLWLLYLSIPFLQPPLQDARYDIIHCHFGPNGRKCEFLRQLGLLHGKSITTFHGADLTRELQQSGDRVYDTLFNQGDLFLPISDRWKQWLIRLGCDPGKIVVHRMGIDGKQFPFIPRQVEPGQPVRIVTVARLVEKKGVEYGIRAIAQVAQTYPNLEYHIVGDGPLKPRLDALIRELQLESVVQLRGWKQQQELVEILNQSHILLAPSVTSQDGDQEGIPVVLMEAMAMGMPVVSTQHSGIPELVEDEVSGLLVPERDVDALSRALSDLVHHPDQWIAMGKAGRDRIDADYTLDTLNTRLVEIYETLLQSDSPVPESRRILSRSV